MGACAFVVAVTVGYAGSSSLARRSGRGERPFVGLSVSEKDLDFGRALAQGDYTITLTLDNSSDAPVRIKEFRKSCGGCTRVDPESLVVPPHGSAQVAVALNLQNQGASRATVLASRSFSASIFPVTVDRVPIDRTWQIRGTVIDWVTISPETYRTFRVAGSKAPVEPQSHLLRSALPLAELTIAAAPAFVAATVQEEDAQHGAYSISVAAASDDVGIHTGGLELRAVPRDEPKPLKISVPVSVEVAHDIEAIPPVVVFGADEANALKRVVLKSRTGTPFKVTNANVPSASRQLNVAVADSSSPDRKAFSIALRSTVEGISDNVTFNVESEHADVPREVSVRVIAQGALDSEGRQ